MGSGQAGSGQNTASPHFLPPKKPPKAHRYHSSSPPGGLPPPLPFQQYFLSYVFPSPPPFFFLSFFFFLFSCLFFFFFPPYYFPTRRRLRHKSSQLHLKADLQHQPPGEGGGQWDESISPSRQVKNVAFFGVFSGRFSPFGLSSCPSPSSLLFPGGF